ncbi:ribosomal maturation YjgA family protein [Flavobacterium sp. 3-218]
MKKSRIYYLLVFLFIIALGILSRKISFIPLWIGDFLYAVMIYFLIRIIFPLKSFFFLAAISLFICYCIEFLQLYQGEWMIELRKTLFGRYVLGQGFLWSDILAYTFGIAIAFLIDELVLNFNRKFA